MSTASILVLVLCMLVVGSFWTLNENIDANMSEIDGLNLIVIYLEDDADVLAIHEKLENIPGDAEITYFSKEENLQKLKDKYAENGMDYLLNIFDDTNNPLPASFELSFDDVSKSSTIKYHLGQIDGISDIKDQLEISESVEEIKSAVTVICTWLLVILAIVSFFVIIITIKLTIASRSKEIILMKNIGATNTFITTPFIIEGIFIGVISAGIALALQYYLYHYVMVNMLSSYDIITVIPFSNFLSLFIVLFLGIGLFAGIIASSISIRKYLHS
ncbi:MAG TPA: permease-like cell division protein FtsX [Bacillota bacterium]|nr:permease-like cell division protein FtsX [Bacillota bacterium]